RRPHCGHRKYQRPGERWNRRRSSRAHRGPCWATSRISGPGSRATDTGSASPSHARRGGGAGRPQGLAGGGEGTFRLQVGGSHGAATLPACQVSVNFPEHKRPVSSTLSTINSTLFISNASVTIFLV